MAVLDVIQKFPESVSFFFFSLSSNIYRDGLKMVGVISMNGSEIYVQDI